MRRIYFVFEVLFALASGQAVKTVLTMYTHLNPLWITPIWLAVSAAVLGVLTLGLNWLSRKQRVESETPSVVSPDPASLLFSPLQIEAFQLAKELREFYEGLEPKPEYDKALLKEDIPRGIADVLTRNNKWQEEADKLTNGYKLRFAGKVADMKHRFGEVGLSSRVFDAVENLEVNFNSETTIPNLAREIERLAVDVNYPDLHKLERKRCSASGGF